MWKRALAGVLTASMALSLAACGDSSSNGGSSADGSTTLEVWSSNLSDSQRENVKKLVAQYEEQTGVKVNYTEFSYDMLDTDEFLGADIVADDSANIASLVEKAVLSETLSDCLDKLSNEEQALLSEYYVYQMPEAELAERYGVNQSTICRRIQRAVAKLKKSMKI